MPGMVTPATIGWNIVSISWRPRKYHGAFDGFGVRFGLANCSSGAFTKAEKMKRKPVQRRAATNSAASRWGHVWTLSTGDAFTSWIEPDFTTVSRRWVWPPGPAPIGTPAGGAAAAATPPGRSATATPPPPPEPSPPPPPAPASPPPPAARCLADRLRSRRWAGMRAAASEVGPLVPAAGASAAPAGAAASDAPPVAAAFLRASSARLRRCSGISVIRAPLKSSCRSQRPRDAAVLADSPEVDRHEDDDDERQHQDVEDVPAQERLRADLDTAEEHEADLTAEHRGVPHHVRAHGDGPQGQLVPRQQVAGEAEQQRERQQDDADDPVELSGRLVGPVVEDAGHVQEHAEDHEVGRPAVHVPYQQPEGDRGLQRVDVVPRLRRGRSVEEHQEDARDRQQDEQEEAEPAEAQRVADLDRVPLHLD